MIFNALANAQRWSRVFSKPTWIWIQVRSAAGPVQIGHDAAECSLAGDGIQLTQANTSTNYPGALVLWQGELWYSGPSATVPFSIVVTEATS